MIKVDEFFDWLHGTMEKKATRFMFGLLLSQVVYAMLHCACCNGGAFVGSLVLSSLVMLTKALADAKYGELSWKDFTASEVGIIVGLLIMLCV
jgi:hypothetical protein